ncbi:putative bifunctional diguanylate cyclase/phosphodiesterase [Pelagibacterium xiamenense]|uniref:putative bifunctional diguanylate cyclase/phosphodiesterase n=1 Tax=Pelagibacterium xiamenense TaxID=2901140 RepID=UPI001E3A5394|nr:EAL domain-containing protein [Pelagibacterium xiamenense]MCD7058330.1 EAL domain-containing protein [Pelagibacterium xiamenense]
MRKSLPALDYVSIVASLYKDRRGMLLGTLASAVGAAACAFKAGSPILYFHAALLLALVIARDYNIRAFHKAQFAPDDVDAAEYWEGRAVFFGYFAALAYGSWCFSSAVFVDDVFAELVSITVTVAAMVGIVTRNFGSDKLMTVQVLGMGGPMVLGLLLAGDIYQAVLASLFLPMLISFRSLGADVRNHLLSAVHERVAAKTLADQLDTALATMQHGLCMIDENGVIALVNDRAEQTFASIAEGAWVGRTVAELLSEAISRRALPHATADRILRMIERQTGGKVVMKLSEDFHCEVTISSRGDRTVLLLENVTERVRTQERINYMARYDRLTGLPNRVQFTELVEADLAQRRSLRRHEPAMLMIVDLDDFKHVNDSLGHLAGDKVLAETARRIGSVIGRDSHVARFGGDEFVVYRSVNTSGMSGGAEAEHILSALSQPFDVDGENVDLKASIGFVRLLEDASDLDELISRADLALYKAKARGKGQWQEFHDALDVEFRYRQRLKADLRDAIASEQIKLVYQPMVSLADRSVVCCEALARWTHPELGPIPPMVFIELAEETGIVDEITRYVLTTATAECANWPETISVSVNVSARDLLSDMLANDVSRALKKSGLPPSRLEIEVTETALIEDREMASRRLRALADRGIGIALDDFGTGYSSLSYLQEMPFSKLKIDRSFVADITTDARSAQLMANVARLGKDLDLTLTAEGVETEEQLALLSAHTQIDQVQGFLFGMPLPATEIRALIGSMGTASNAIPQLRLTRG